MHFAEKPAKRRTWQERELEAEGRNRSNEHCDDRIIVL